jgi:hypothetical protein
MKWSKFIFIMVICISMVLIIGFMAHSDVKEIKSLDVNNFEDIENFIEACNDKVIIDCQSVLMDKLKEIKDPKCYCNLQGISQGEFVNITKEMNGESCPFVYLDFYPLGEGIQPDLNETLSYTFYCINGGEIKDER